MVPDSGASPEEIDKEESLLKRNFSPQHKQFLEKWNGIDLEVVRLYCCSHRKETPRRLVDEQIFSLNKSFLVIGSDASGFIYLEKNDDFQIFVFDTKSNEIIYLADTFDDFFEQVIFGEKAREFSGEEWAEELRLNNILK